MKLKKLHLFLFIILFSTLIIKNKNVHSEIKSNNIQADNVSNKKSCNNKICSNIIIYNNYINGIIGLPGFLIYNVAQKGKIRHDKPIIDFKKHVEYSDIYLKLKDRYLGIEGFSNYLLTNHNLINQNIFSSVNNFSFTYLSSSLFGSLGFFNSTSSGNISTSFIFPLSSSLSGSIFAPFLQSNFVLSFSFSDLFTPFSLFSFLISSTSAPFASVLSLSNSISSSGLFSSSLIPSISSFLPFTSILSLSIPSTASHLLASGNFSSIGLSSTFQIGLSVVLSSFYSTFTTFKSANSLLSLFSSSSLVPSIATWTFSFLAFPFGLGSFTLGSFLSPFAGGFFLPISALSSSYWLTPSLSSLTSTASSILSFLGIPLTLSSVPSISSAPLSSSLGLLLLSGSGLTAISSSASNLVNLSSWVPSTLFIGLPVMSLLAIIPIPAFSAAGWILGGLLPTTLYISSAFQIFAISLNTMSSQLLSVPSISTSFISSVLPSSLITSSSFILNFAILLPSPISSGFSISNSLTSSLPTYSLSSVIPSSAISSIVSFAPFSLFLFSFTPALVSLSNSTFSLSLSLPGYFSSSLLLPISLISYGSISLINILSLPLTSALFIDSSIFLPILTPLFSVESNLTSSSVSGSPYLSAPFIFSLSLINYSLSSLFTLSTLSTLPPTSFIAFSAFGLSSSLLLGSSINFSIINSSAISSGFSLISPLVSSSLVLSSVSGISSAFTLVSDLIISGFSFLSTLSSLNSSFFSYIFSSGWLSSIPSSSSIAFSGFLSSSSVGAQLLSSSSIGLISLFSYWPSSAGIPLGMSSSAFTSVLSYFTSSMSYIVGPLFVLGVVANVGYHLFFDIASAFIYSSTPSFSLSSWASGIYSTSFAFSLLQISSLPLSIFPPSNVPGSVASVSSSSATASLISGFLISGPNSALWPISSIPASLFQAWTWLTMFVTLGITNPLLNLFVFAPSGSASAIFGLSIVSTISGVMSASTTFSSLMSYLPILGGSSLQFISALSVLYPVLHWLIISASSSNFIVSIPAASISSSLSVLSPLSIPSSSSVLLSTPLSSILTSSFLLSGSLSLPSISLMPSISSVFASSIVLLSSSFTSYNTISLLSFFPISSSFAFSVGLPFVGSVGTSLLGSVSSLIPSSFSSTPSIFTSLSFSPSLISALPSLFIGTPISLIGSILVIFPALNVAAIPSLLSGIPLFVSGSISMLPLISNPSIASISNPSVNPISAPFSNWSLSPISNPLISFITNPSLSWISNPFVAISSGPSSINPSSIPSSIISNPISGSISNPSINPSSSSLINPALSWLSNPISSPFSNPISAPFSNPSTSFLSNPITSSSSNPSSIPSSNPLSISLSNPMSSIAIPVGFSSSLPSVAPQMVSMLPSFLPVSLGVGARSLGDKGMKIKSPKNYGYEIYNWNKSKDFEFKNLVTFGDSLSDTGSFGRGSIYMADGNPFVFYNNLLSIYLTGKILVPDTFGGTNYARSGAIVRPIESIIDIISDPLSLGRLDLKKQISWYLDDNNGKADKDSIYLIWIGGNDMTGDIVRMAIDIPEWYSIINSNHYFNDKPTVAASYAQWLADAGAGNIFVLNLPDPGIAPFTGVAIISQIIDGGIAISTDGTIFEKLNLGHFLMGFQDKYLRNMNNIVGNPKGRVDEFVIENNINATRSFLPFISEALIRFGYEFVMNAQRHMVNQWNNDLLERFRKVKSEGNLIYVDVYKLFQEITNDYTAYGIDNILVPECELGWASPGCDETDSYYHGKDGNIYMYTDWHHPSGYTQGILSEYILSILQAPGYVSALSKSLEIDENARKNFASNYLKIYRDSNIALGDFDIFAGLFGGFFRDGRALYNKGQNTQNIGIGTILRLYSNFYLGGILALGDDHRKPANNFYYKNYNQSLTLFAQYHNPNGIWVNGTLFEDMHQFKDIERLIQLGKKIISENGSTRGNITGLTLSFGYDIPLNIRCLSCEDNKYYLSPYFETSITKYNVREYEEKGYASTSMAFSKQRRNVKHLTTGIQLVAKSLKYKTNLDIAYNINSKNSNNDIFTFGRIKFLDDIVFKRSGKGLSKEKRSWISITPSVDYYLNNNFSIYGNIGYNLGGGSKNTSMNTSIGVKGKF